MKTLVKQLVPYPITLIFKEALRFIVALFFIGNKYACPFCGWKYRKFLMGGKSIPFFKENKIIGGGRRPNMLCPKCHSTDRDRLVYCYLISNELFYKQHSSLLHIAPEPSLKKYLKKISNFTYYCGDKFEKGYDKFYYDRETMSLDLTSLSFSPESFDIIICNHVLEHIVDENKALSEIKRVLKPDGWAILQVPVSPELMVTLEDPTDSDKDREFLYGQHDHVRLYGIDYVVRLRAHGFNVEVWNPEKQLSKIELERYALNKEENVFIASKTII